MGEREGGSRSERKRRGILEAGRAIFLNEGYAGAGMEQVARAASVSTATLYAHFPSKADLFEAVVGGAIARLTHDLEDARVEGGARQRLLALALALGRFYSAPLSRSLFRLVTSERRRFNSLADRFLERSRVEIGGAAVALVADLREAGLIRVAKPAWAAGQLLGMIEHATLVIGLMAGDEVNPRRPLEAICEDAVETFLARYGA
ncbi:MAG TPA: TetR/AcrR family transcriptional regulator [Caulobacter sp.]|nr:TetR/AcrR family transcriptional regulator [Caulobacter sp.]